MHLRRKLPNTSYAENPSCHQYHESHWKPQPGDQKTLLQGGVSAGTTTYFMQPNSVIFPRLPFLDVLLCDKRPKRTCCGVLEEFNFIWNIWSGGYITHQSNATFYSFLTWLLTSAACCNSTETSSLCPLSHAQWSRARPCNIQEKINKDSQKKA